MTIEYLSLFVSRVDSFLSLASSSSSFIVASFLIQMLRWIRSSSRVEFFIFLLLDGSSLDGKSLILSCSHLIFSSYDSSFFFFSKSAKSNHFLLAHIPQMNEYHDPGRPFKVAITTFAFFTSSSSCSLI